MNTQFQARNSASDNSSSVTFPHGFIDFLKVSQGRRRRIGEFELEPANLERFNDTLRTLSPDAPRMSLDQIATAAERALERHADGSTPSFVQSRMAALKRLEGLAVDADWDPSEELQRQVGVLRAYRDEEKDLIADDEPVIGLLDDAILVDVALQLLHSELADYEDYSRFRKIAAEFAGVPESETGLTRVHWLEAMTQAHDRLGPINAPRKVRFVDPRASLFHIG